MTLMKPEDVSVGRDDAALALITSRGIRSATCLLTVLRRPMALLLLCWTVISWPWNRAGQ
ncbi:hypothetical protein [Nonomuraea sp. NEAU-A123]|uniref:hypothetical protein n=1 Tax=Nonomuraea sp. NEAU-A123 TaxID=2839649 RepID=UPI001BE4B1ED|nr:hypothetical protein [Nonomuraea sp. NEAU-A123]MBT2225034.1 hypothetical protein [Nonomuraea sp. NEAU-A123]